MSWGFFGSTIIGGLFALGTLLWGFRPRRGAAGARALRQIRLSPFLVRLNQLALVEPSISVLLDVVINPAFIDLRD